jgi:hypothetical protein
MASKSTLREQVMRRLNAGNPSVASKVHELEVEEAIKQVLNTMLRTQYFETLQVGDNIPEGCVLAFYEDVPVVSYKGVSRCTLPAIPVTLPRNIGVFSVKPHSTEDTDGGNPDSTGNITLDGGTI